MSCHLSELVLNCHDPEMLSRFWCDVLGYVELGREDADIEIGPESGFGARPADVGQTGEESWHVLADPEGNEFCLLSSRLPELKAQPVTESP
ncbi:hypothetical protein BSP239C_02878 [Brevibacterium sp. 239c]|uniref:VOC family protein n=1 Tax=Brevibacterium sp. 239c TaxID=1965356 RepID=UPI000C43B158|nr:VOC family protein [Brevibacterium sp. 239c]SMX98140.1 hypothetical protein BSP239C_02878 [Brevibacterium sp. 239c]